MAYNWLVSFWQSWAHSVFLNFFNNKKWFFCIFYHVNNLFLHQSYLKSPLPVKLAWQKMQTIIFAIEKIIPKYLKCPALGRPSFFDWARPRPRRRPPRTGFPLCTARSSRRCSPPPASGGWPEGQPGWESPLSGRTWNQSWALAVFFNFFTN